MKVINLGDRSSVINSYMAQLRDVNIQENRTLFRRNLERIARAMAYEVSPTPNPNHQRQLEVPQRRMHRSSRQRL